MSTPRWPDPSLRPLPVEDLWARGPEWEVLLRDPTNIGEGREFWWDPVHGWIKHEGPTIEVTIPPDHTRPY